LPRSRQAYVKPNLHPKQSQFRRADRPGADYAKQSQFLDCGLRISDWGQTCGGTPRAPCRLGLRGAGRTNKTRPTKVGINRTDPWYQPGNAGRKPIRGLLSWASNKANSGRHNTHYSTILLFHQSRLRRAKCAKQTQFARLCRATLPRPSTLRPRASPLGRRRLCETKPIPGEARWDGARGAGDVGVIAPNKPNVRRSQKKSKGLAGKELW
jgi:hypothetical protein